MDTRERNNYDCLTLYLISKGYVPKNRDVLASEFGCLELMLGLKDSAEYLIRKGADCIEKYVINYGNNVSTSQGYNSTSL